MDEIQTWSTPVTSLGVAAILAWFLWYTTSTLIPGIHRDHTAAVERMHDEHLETTERICQQFTESLADERELRAREFEMSRQLFRCHGGYPQHQPIHQGQSHNQPYPHGPVHREA